MVKVFENKIVVCLKGGDLFIFGWLLEEIYVLVEYDIFFVIVLGVIVVSVCVVYMGILLIDRWCL